MRFTTVLGPPGAGKSTYVQEHRAPADAVIDFDLIAQACGATQEHDAPPTVGTMVMAGRSAMIARALESLTGERDPLEGDVWLAASFLADSTIEEWAAKGVEFVLVDPGIDETKRRAVADGRPERSIQLIDDWYAAPPKIPGKAGDRVLRFKEAPVETSGGLLVGYASVFGNVDSYGDVVMPGAFAKSLAKYGEAGAGIPVLWGHRMDDPMMNVGATVKAYEDAHGLRVEMRLDPDNPTAAQAQRLVEQGRVKAMSFAYDVVDGAPAEREGRDVFELRELDIHEVSIVHVGANRLAEIHAAKAAQTPTAPVVEETEIDLDVGLKAAAMVALESTLARHEARTNRKDEV